MKNLQPFLLVLLVAAFLFPQGVSAIEPGDTAPDFTLTDTQGTDHSLSQYSGTVVYLFFFGYS